MLNRKDFIDRIADAQIRANKKAGGDTLEARLKARAFAEDVARQCDGLFKSGTIKISQETKW